METPDTPAQAAARKEYDDASRELAAASVAVQDARARYYRAFERYNIAFGKAHQAGILK